MAALNPILDNSSICVIQVLVNVVFFQLEIFLVPSVMTDFQLYPGHFGYQVMRFWVLFSCLSQVTFSDTILGGEEGVPPPYYQRRIDIQAPHLASIETQQGGAPRYFGAEVGDHFSIRALLTPLWVAAGEVLLLTAFHVVSTDRHLIGGTHYGWRVVKILVPHSHVSDTTRVCVCVCG